MINATKPIILSIAGTDPSGGAGIQADIKSISANGGYAASVITALVAQNTCGVQGIQTIPPNFITQQLESVFNDLTIAAVKIGMLHDAQVIKVIAQALSQYHPPIVVLDPVMVAKNGSPLLQKDAIDALQQLLLPKVQLITPNLSEAEALVQDNLTDRDSMSQAAMQLGDAYGCRVLIKGGHLLDEESPDVLFDPTPGTIQWFESKRISTRNTHGTGCSLSSAIATYLGRGYSYSESIQHAKYYLTQAIEHGALQTIGHGSGPVDHFYFLNAVHQD